jgi:hypothetical protein
VVERSRGFSRLPGFATRVAMGGPGAEGTDEGTDALGGRSLVEPALKLRDVDAFVFSGSCARDAESRVPGVRLRGAGMLHDDAGRIGWKAEEDAADTA